MRHCIFYITLFLGLVACSSSTHEVTEWYNSEQTKTVQYFNIKNNNKQLVKEVQYYSNGKMAYQKEFKDSLPNGEWVFWYSNGNIWSKGYYRKGARTGLSLVYHENGQLFFQGKYVNGQKEGKWLFYDDAGKLVNESEFKDGKSTHPTQELK